jgi:alkylation response protein AidB-like acyl-CoA dehydrogenase
VLVREHARQGRQLHGLEQGQGRQDRDHPLSDRDDFFARLLERARSPAGEPVPAGDWLASLPQEVRFAPAPLGAVLLSSVRAAAPAHAVAAGHQSALRALFPELVRREIVAFCASEEGGAHPRAIHTTLVTEPGGGLRLDGVKRWATLAPSASTLLVVASLGREGERNVLRLARVPADREGVQVEPMPPAGFLPELGHAVVTLRGVAVAVEEVVEGDAYLQAVKPFRTVEDLHVAAGLVAFTLGVGVRSGWPRPALERSLALLAAARDLAVAPPAAPGTHLCLAGWLDAVRSARAEDEPLWQRVDTALAAAWHRDTAREVAAEARERRRERAWERVLGSRLRIDGDPR